MPRVAGAGVTWVTLRLSVIRYQHGKEQAHSACAFTHYAVLDSNEGTPWCVVGDRWGNFKVVAGAVVFVSRMLWV
jgi:hypothetical protein